MSDVGPIQYAVIDSLGGNATQVGPVQYAFVDELGGQRPQVSSIFFAEVQDPLPPPPPPPGRYSGAMSLVGKQLNRGVYKGAGTTGGLLYFRYGEGGSIKQAGGVTSPVDPDDSGLGYTTRANVDATVDIDVDPSNPGLRYKQKSFSPGDLYPDPTGVSTLICRCFMDFGEGNYALRNPVYFELGVFDTNDVMLAYGTFPGREKTNSVQLEYFVKVTF